MKIRPALWLFLLALATAGTVVVMTGFDGLYGQDAFHYLGCSRRILDMPLQALRPGTCYWPFGYPLLEALFLLLTGSASFGAQLASMVTGAAIAPLVYWLALESTAAADPARTRVALAAGLLTALCGQLLLSSIVVMSDAPALFWATLSAAALLRWARDGDRHPILWLVSCAATLAIASITRWIYAALLLPFGVFAVVALWRRQSAFRESPPGAQAASGALMGGQPTSGAVTGGHPASAVVTGVPAKSRGWIAARRVPSLLLAAAIFLLIFLPQLHVSQQSESPALSHGWLVGWNPLNALRTVFDNPDGHFHYRFPPAFFYAAPLVHPFYLSTLLAPFVFLGAWVLRRSPALLLLGGWILILYGYLVGVPYENGRFPLAFFPPVAVLAAIGLGQLACRWQHSQRVFWAGMAVALVTAAPFAYRGITSLTQAKAREVSAMHYLQARVPPNAVIVTFGLSATLEHYTREEVVDLFAQTPATLRPVVCGVRPAYVYIEQSNIESQWAGKSPAINFQWLQQAVGLDAVGSQGTWTLHRVRHC